MLRELRESFPDLDFAIGHPPGPIATFHEAHFGSLELNNNELTGYKSVSYSM